MGRKKKEAGAPESVFAKKPWWLTCTPGEFKEKIGAMSWEECNALAALMKEEIRRTTLRPFLEDYTLEDQKIAARLAPVHRGRHEILFARIRMFQRPNAKPAE